MFTLNLPVVIDASVLRLAMQTAHATGSEVRINTFFRVRLDDRHVMDCDTEREVRDTPSWCGLRRR